MKFVYFQQAVSPHVIPLVREIVNRLGADEVRYVCKGALDQGRIAMGWSLEHPDWVIDFTNNPEESVRWTEDCPFMICGIREFDLIEHRLKKGLSTIYASERWFKPIMLGQFWGLDILLPGWLRLLFPRYLKMILRLRRMVQTYKMFRLFPVGVHAMRDMTLMGIPKERMTLWGYFVESTNLGERAKDTKLPLRVLWVGRMIRWKRVDTIVRAATALGNGIELTLVGNGPERFRLERMSRGANVHFMDSVPIEEVRKLMRQHDIYVLASNACEGWGAVVNEALEERMCVIGTYEAGASATLLEKACLFHSEDWKQLKRLLQKVMELKVSGRMQVQCLKMCEIADAADCIYKFGVA